MILYKPSDWRQAIFRFQGRDTIRILWPYLLLMAVFTATVAYLETEYLRLVNTEYLKNTTVMHSLLGFAISMLLVFRTNTAYDRWWEGRRQLGALVNASRNFALKIQALLPEQDQSNRRFFIQTISSFALELSVHLGKEVTRLSLDDSPHPEIPNFENSAHIPNEIMAVVHRKVKSLQDSKIIDEFDRLSLNTELQIFTDVCGACERIKNTPIPYSYSSFLKKFIFIYVSTLPFGFVFSLGYYTIPVVVFIFYVLASLELIAEEIEEPFGNDINDLPTHKIAANIQKNISKILLP